MAQSDAKPGLRRAWPLIWLVLLGGVSLWIWWYYLANPAFFPLQVVRIQGEFRYLDPGRIEPVLDEHLVNSGFFNLDLPQLQALCLALPWVAEAHVRRVWPNAVHITLVEQVPLARWGDANPVAWINADGELFQPTQTVALDLPVLVGPEDQAAELVALLQQIRTSLSGSGLDLRRLQRHPPGSWTVQLHPELTILLSQHQPLQRWRDFIQIYPQLPKPARRIDLRYRQGFAVLFKDAA